jgi:hypothetical protein
MLGSREFRQPTLMTTLVRRMESADIEVNVRRDNESVVDLGQSMVGVYIKNSHFMESKLTQNRADLLKVSGIQAN